MLDFAAVIPFYLEVAFEELMRTVKTLRVLRAVRLIRCFRIFKLSKYSSGMTIMVESVLNSVQPLSILTFFLCIGVVLTSSLMYYAERASCPDVKAKMAKNIFKQYLAECIDLDTGWTRSGELCCNKYGSALDFPSISKSFWWAVVTMTTVGYGDVGPRTFLGRLVGCLAMLSGIVLISLPVAIVGSKFQMAYESLEEEKRKFEIQEAQNQADPSQDAVPVAADSMQDDAHIGEESKDQSQMSGGLRCLVPEPPPAPQNQTSSDQYFANLLAPLRARLRHLEKKDTLSDKALDELLLLLEMFDHIERVEKQLKGLRDRDDALDKSIRKEFAALSKVYDSFQMAVRQ